MIKNLERCFSSCGYANDFEAFIDVCDIIDFEPYRGYELWLKAYDTSCEENVRERKLQENGYGYELCACLIGGDCYIETGYDTVIFNEAAKDREEALDKFHKLLQDKKRLQDAIDNRLMLASKDI